VATHRIHPSIGVARLGNSPHEFYLAPETVGGLPIACDESGNAVLDDRGEPAFVDQFKDGVGRVKRQAARFRVFADGPDGPHQVELGDEVEKIVWTVHLANKKAIWFTFSELLGDLEFGPDNSYANRNVPVNNPDVTGDARKALMIDPGPRSIERPGDAVEMSRSTIPDDYQHGSFPPSSGGTAIDTLGELRMDESGNLVALGGFGNVAGSGDITSFRGASGYWDDVADGLVLATIHLSSGETIDAEPAWLLVGSPKYAPELVNITTLWDTAYDTAVRFLGAAPDLFDPAADTAVAFAPDGGYTPLAGYDPDYVVDFATQVEPILDRIAGYRWVADVPYLSDVATPGFDVTDASDANRANRERFFELFRVPLLPADHHDVGPSLPNGPNQLFASSGIPLLPLNSGDNSVTNDGPIYKFETLSVTQYFFLRQWSVGSFTVDETRPPEDLPTRLDRASIGNCVGAPFSPGIETTWITRNAPIYDDLARLRLAHWDGSNADLAAYYAQSGLSTTADEAEGQGCEPGDLTKRMAIPWQSDFQECTVQTPNITDPAVNQFADGTGIEVPPAYYVYWWPPQSPMHVVSGSLQPEDQVLDAVVSRIDGQPIIPAGQRVPYQRGIDTVQDMLASWSRLGFVVDRGTTTMPYFVETERNSQALVQILLDEQADADGQ
jgi:L-lysine 6-oxidase